ncbi:MAG: thioredoxin domain-containing protein [Chloroflexi bacterium]|nr:thioredoxin domain-containing protein [Chloroflexota bacterium]
MKSSQRQALYTIALCALVGVVLAVLLVACAATNPPAPSASEATPQTVATATNQLTTTVEATTAVTNTEASTSTTVTNTETPTSTTAVTTTQTPTETKEATGATSATLVSTEKYKDIPVGFTKEGFPYRGNPDAPIVMVEYSDYQCPFCSRYFTTTEPVIDESYVRSGKVRVVFRDFPIVQLHPNAPAAANAANCVADQGAAKFWAMHDQLFQTQGEWSNLPDPNAYFAQLVEKAGADQASYDQCVKSGTKTAFVQNGVAEAEKVGFSGTPSFQFVRTATNESFPLVGAQPVEQFVSLIDTLVAGKKPEQAQAEPAPQGDQQIPVWATAAGLKPDPKRPGYTMAGDEYRGNPDAKVVVVEFSDFQCPFCRRHVQETQPTLDKTFVDTNEIFWVFKNFPLSIHPQAPAAAIAAECAANQGKFWEMHELLFKDAAPWSISDPNPIFSELAKQLGLNTDQFTSCLGETGEGSAQQRVQSDMEDGKAFVQGTPTFVVLFNGEGRIIPGALPVDRFTTVLQQVVDGKPIQ